MHLADQEVKKKALKETARRRADDDAKKNRGAAQGTTENRHRKPTIPPVLTIERSNFADAMAKLIAPGINADMDMNKPFVLTNVKSILSLASDSPGLKEVMVDFEKTFGESTIKVTEGRAQKRFDDPALASLVSPPLPKLQKACR